MADANTRPATCRSLGDGRVGIWVHFDDRAEAKALPSARWDPGLKCWWVHELFAAEARELVQRLNARFEHRPGTSVVPVTAAFKSLFAALPEPWRRPTHRALARVLHPDQGGDNTLMRALNDAWGGGAE